MNIYCPACGRRLAFSASLDRLQAGERVCTCERCGALMRVQFVRGPAANGCEARAINIALSVLVATGEWEPPPAVLRQDGPGALRSGAPAPR